MDVLLGPETLRVEVRPYQQRIVVSDWPDFFIGHEETTDTLAAMQRR